MIDEESFVAVAEVTVGEAIHEAITEGIELLRCSGLRDAGASAAGRAEGCDRSDVGAGKRGVGTRGEVDVEAPGVQAVGAEAEEVFVGAARRCGSSIDVRGENSAVGVGELEALLCAKCSC